MRKQWCIMLINMKNYSDQVRHAIDQCGLSRYAISKATGITEGGLSRFMSGENDMTLRMLDRIAPVIGVSLKVSKPKRAKTKGR